MIEHAYDIARDAHREQVRRSGEPYITHPVGVALVLADLGLDDVTIAAALLHDAVEDTTVTKDDTGLDAATVFTYQVSTHTADGTSVATEKTVSTFQAAFDVRPAAATSQPNFAGDFTFVQRIGAAKLLAGGSTVGIKVRGAPASNVTINRIYISQVGAGNPWNSAGDLTPVITSPPTLPNAQPVDLDPISYNLDKSQDLIIAFDFTAASGADTIAFVSPEPGVTLYFKAGVQQASVQTRDPGYSTGPSQIYLVATIGVP